MKLLLITNYPSKYRVDLFHLLYQKCGGASGIRFVFIPDHDTHKKSISDYEADFAKASYFREHRRWRNLFWLMRLLVSFRPDRVIVGGLNEYSALVLIGRFFLGYKAFAWWGGTPLSEAKRRKRFWMRKQMARWFSGGIYYSSKAEEFFLTLAPQQHHRFVLGNNTRDVEKIREQIEGAPRLYAPSDSAIHIITIGFQEKRKNTIALLKAAKILLHDRNVSGFQIDVVGDGDMLPECRQYSNTWNLPVTFHGARSNEDALILLSQSDILVHPSLYDQWPQVYSEAMCCGIPALLSNSSGVYNCYTERHGSQVLFDGDNVEELANKLMMLCDNPDLRKLLAAAQKQCAQESDARIQTDRLLDFLKRA